MGKEIKVRIIMRYNSTDGWAALQGGDAILAKGEIGLEYIPGSALPKMKIGTGELTWDNLPYFEIKLPENFTWGDLRGTPLQTRTTQTTNLNLAKPGFLDVVNIVTLNKNFETIDQHYKFHTDELNQLGQRITDLIKIAEENYPVDEIGKQVLEARVRYDGTAYETLGDTLRAIDQDLQTYKATVNAVIQDLKMPTSLKLDETTGQIYLIDKEGNQIGSAVTVKDSALELKVNTLDSSVKRAEATLRNHNVEISDIKNTISNLPSSFPNNLIYEENMLYLAVGDEKIEESGVEIVGGGGGPGVESTYKIEFTAEERNISKPLGEEVILSFNYRSYDREDETITDGPGSGELLINNIQRATFTVQQGANTFNATKYLVAGTNTLKIKVTNSEGSSKTLQFNVMVLSLTISSNFPKLSKQTSGLLPISYTVTSETEFTSHFVITKQNAILGEDYFEPTEVFSETFSRGTTSTAYLDPLPSGTYTLEVYATSGETPSNLLTFGLIIYLSSDVSPFIVMLPEKTTFTQGEIISIPYMIYHPNNSAPSITFSIYSINDESGEKELYYTEVIPNVGQSAMELTSQRYPIGNVIFEIACGEVKNSVNLTVNKSDVELDLFKEDLLFEFDPAGRTNQNSAGVWSYIDKDTKEEKFATFSNIDWGILDGWQIKKDENGKILEDQTMLRILPGGRMEIPFHFFDKEITSNNMGYTIEVEVATQNVTDYDALIIDAFDETEGLERGLKIYSQSAELKSQNNTISAQFREDERIRLTFTIEPSTLNKLIMIYINGVLCGIKQYDTDVFKQDSPTPIIIGAEDSGIDVYFIRAYRRTLDKDQQLNNFCVDRPSYADKVAAKTRNDILNASAGGDLTQMITIDSLKGAIPYIIMHCPKLPANKDQDKFKGMKMTFVDPADPTRSFTATDCTFSVQGTSSAGYPVKNFKIKLGKKGITYTRNNQVSEAGFYFEGPQNSQPTKVFCLKADYASSENANNVMLVDYYNETSPYRNEAQQYQLAMGQKETVRHGVHGEPIVLFWQEIDPITGLGSGKISFQGKYNFNDDKDSENVFGYVGVLPEDIYNIECWEFTNNNMDLCLFKHNLTEGDNAWFKEVKNDKGEMVPAWSNSFERRFPEQEDDEVPDMTAFRRMVDWVASTNTVDVFDTPLKTPVYYQTLDKGYVENKSYYQKNEDGSFSPFTVITEDTTFSYSSSVRIDNTIMVPKIQAILSTETRPIDLIFTKKENSSWRLYYLEDEKEVELDGDIADLKEYGIAFDTISDLDDSTIENFSIQFYKGNNWTSRLYEYHDKDTSSYRLAKFKNEFEDYFILRAMAYYYVYTETVLLMDNRAKNMFLVCYDVDSKILYDEDGKVTGSEKQPKGTYGHWAPTPYDMDSALGINNEGELVYSYHLEDTYEDGKVFTGQDSILWNNFRDCFQSEIAAMYIELRGQHGTTNGSKPFSYETLSEKMNNHQSMWPEVIWNIDQQIKYLTPFYNSNGDVDHLAMAQGDKRAQRNFWLYNAFKYRDSKYSAGDALDNYILFRLNGHGEFNIVPYSNIYARVKFGNALDLKKRALRNQTATFSTTGISSIYDLETYIYSADRISSIGDLSDFHIGLCNFASATKLKEIILGSEREGYKNTYLKNFRAGSSTVLKEVNLSNCTSLAMEINLSGCPNLQIFKAGGSAITGVSFAKNARLHTCIIPKTVSVLSLLDLQYLTKDGLQVEKDSDEKYTFTGIRLENCPHVPFYDLISNSKNLRVLRLRGLDWHTTLGTEDSTEPCFMAFFKKIKTLGRINEDGTQENYSEENNIRAHVAGKIYLEEEIDAELLEEVNAKFPELTLVIKDAPRYFLTFKDFNNEVICRYVASEGSTPLDPTRVQIPGIDKTPEQILALLNSRPEEDRFKYEEDPENETDTRYLFSRWEGFPQQVTESLILSPIYITQYRLKFFYPEGTNKVVPDDIWVNQGENAPDPRDLSEDYIIHKEPNAEFSFTHSGWDKSLLNIQAAINFRPVFDSIQNTYDVIFYTNLIDQTTQELKPIEIHRSIPYGEIVPEPDDSKKIYYLNGDINTPSELHEFEKWICDTPGVDGLTITPSEYQETPISMTASFIFMGDKNDTPWEYIALVAAAGNQAVEITADNCLNPEDIGKIIPPIYKSSVKDVYFTYNGIDYVSTMELVELNFDNLAFPSENYNNNSSKATFTFLCRDIPFNKPFNSGNRTFSFPFMNPSTGEIVYVSSANGSAGGWPNSTLREWAHSDFLDSLRENNPGLDIAIKPVTKISDMGRPVNSDIPSFNGIQVFSGMNQTSDDWIWIPSTTELNLNGHAFTTTEVMDSQSSVINDAGEYQPYSWFSTDNTRIKTLEGVPANYWTRTHVTAQQHRFIDIEENGSIGDGIRSGDVNTGFVFGFCI